MSDMADDRQDEAMETVAPKDVSEITPIHRDSDAAELALAAYERMTDLLEDLSPAEWEATTDCEPWTVADVVGHLLGAAEANASVGTLLRQQLHGLRHRSAFDGSTLDAANDLQVREHARLAPDQRISEPRRLAARAVRGRMRLPAVLRRIDVPLDQTGSAAPGTPRKLNLGRLMDVVYTRDVWLHRIDVARATDREPDVDSRLDRRVVEDVVAEWASRHGRPFELALGGPAGGRFRQGGGGEVLGFDAVEFCRALSGRTPAGGLLGTRVVF